MDANESRYSVTYTGNEVIRIGRAGVFQSGTRAWLNEEDARAAAALPDFTVEGLGAPGAPAPKPAPAKPEPKVEAKTEAKAEAKADKKADKADKGDKEKTEKAEKADDKPAEKGEEKAAAK